MGIKKPEIKEGNLQKIQSEEEDLFAGKEWNSDTILLEDFTDLSGEEIRNKFLENICLKLGEIRDILSFKIDEKKSLEHLSSIAADLNKGLKGMDNELTQLINNIKERLTKIENKIGL